MVLLIQRICSSMSLLPLSVAIYEKKNRIQRITPTILEMECKSNAIFALYTVTHMALYYYSNKMQTEYAIFGYINI